MAARRAVMALLLIAGHAGADDELPNAIPTVMEKRWAAAMSYGVSGARARTEGAELQSLVFFELAFRVRVVPELELGVSGGGSAVRSFGFAAIQIDVRHRIAPEHAWNPFVYGGGGIATWSVEGSSRLVLRAGAGLERRFEQWAFDARVELTRVSPDPTAAERDLEERHGVWAASVAMSALYYWGSGGRAKRRRGAP
jgi:hypothetical protein